MLELTIPGAECFNEATNEFLQEEDVVLRLEHSLYAISMWESKWKKPFLSAREKDRKTIEEFEDYIRCMTLNQEKIDPAVYRSIRREDYDRIQDYISDSMTATWFREDNKKESNEIITAEIVYYWLVALEIPFEVQYWHFNKMMTLIRVTSIKNQPSKKLSQNEILKQNRAANLARRRPKL